MGMWNNHGLGDDDEEIKASIDSLGLFPDELIALVEHARREVWVWTEIARHRKGQQKRKANLIAKFWQLRLDKWIELTAWAEMEYEHEFGAFADDAGRP